MSNRECAMRPRDRGAQNSRSGRMRTSLVGQCHMKMSELSDGFEDGDVDGGWSRMVFQTIYLGSIVQSRVQYIASDRDWRCGILAEPSTGVFSRAS